MIAFELQGEPQAWQRAGRRKGGKGFFTQTETREFERRVRGMAGSVAIAQRVELPLAGAVLLHVSSVFAPPQRGALAGELKATRPDVDNVAKGVSDALNAGVLRDDGQVAILVAEKWYAARGEEPRTEVLVRPIETALVRVCCPLCGAARRCA